MGTVDYRQKILRLTQGTVGCNMAWYKSAGYKFWIALTLEYFLILAGMVWHNSYMVFGGIIINKSEEKA